MLFARGRFIAARRMNRRESGSVLILVVWLILFLAGLAVALYGIVSPRVRAARVLRQRGDIDAQARSGLELARAALAKDNSPGCDTWSDSWANDPDTLGFLNLPGGAVRIRYDDPARLERLEDPAVAGLCDEARKLHLNAASPQELARLIEIVAKVDAGTAERLALAVADWRDVDDEPRPGGAESEVYGAMTPPYGSANGPVETLEELHLIQGMTPEIVAAISPWLTIHGPGTVNINTAETPVLDALGLGTALAQTIVDYRLGPDATPGTPDDARFDSVSDIDVMLNRDLVLTRQEKTRLSSVLEGGRLGVSSTHFSARSEALDEEGNVVGAVRFVLARDGSVAGWLEE